MIAVLYQAVPPGAPPDVADVLAQADVVCAALARLGHDVRQIPVSLDLTALLPQLESDVDVVFNLVEELDGQGRLAALLPWLLEQLGLPFTGASAAELRRADDKLESKLVLLEAGIPTPAFRVEGGPWRPRPVSGHVIIKARAEHGSLGLEADSVVETASESRLDAQLAAARQRLGREVFAEAYVHGREFSVALIPQGGQLIALEPSELCFEDWPANAARIVGYRAKWAADSPEYAATPRRDAFSNHDTPLLEQLRQLALLTARALEIETYCRVDLRVDERGVPFVLELNANPCLAPDAGFQAALARAAIDFESFLAATLAAARSRAVNRSVTRALDARVAMDRDAKPRATAAAAPLRSSPRPTDVEAVRQLVQGTGFFTDEEIGIAGELVEERLGRGESSGYYFSFLDEGSELLAYACWGPTPGTEQSLDLYWIAVRAGHQSRGLGGRVLRDVEARIATLGLAEARLYAETSGSQRYAPTRAFYVRHGFEIAARIADFYRPGDAKLTFVKRLP